MRKAGAVGSGKPGWGGGTAEPKEGCAKAVFFLKKRWWVDAQAHLSTATKNSAVC